MAVAAVKRDYSLVGPDSRAAEQKGLASAQWYACPLPRKELKELMRRKDGPAIRDTLLWLGGLGVSGALAYHFWGSWLFVPFFALYGVLYGSATDSRWHECGHGTAFKTRWLNDVVYHIACFMILREPTIWRWSHTRHHTDTIIVGRDPEISVPRPPDVPAMLMGFFNIKGGPKEYKKVLLHCFGKLTAEETTYIPEMEYAKVFWTARVWVAIYAATIGWAIAIHSFLPLMLIGLPSFYGFWLPVTFGLTQ